MSANLRHGASYKGKILLIYKYSHLIFEGQRDSSVYYYKKLRDCIQAILCRYKTEGEKRQMNKYVRLSNLCLWTPQILGFGKWTKKNSRFSNLGTYTMAPKERTEYNAELTMFKVSKVFSFVYNCILWLSSHRLWVVSHHCFVPLSWVRMIQISRMVSMEPP